MELRTIQSKIYEIRGQKVILDFDLAELYQSDTRSLNQAVKRNIKRFPPDFMFQLTTDEWSVLISQFVTSSWGGTRKRPFAFTEQGVAMLSGLLKSDIAIEVNISIMRAFVAMRQYLLNSTPSPLLKELKDRIEALEDITEENEEKFDEIYLALAQLAQKNKQNNKPRNPIGFVKPQ
ncbi:ORF6N domain-containing protein [uncultured Parabacteroides sp.]|uniref:ORF6N domain-containing protein n=1 Tax=uncultured Parabacteroides sp. TaxID=512312 RepID=UPI0026DC15CD|nr:ORF6N domain-containing protein [uncultured Parabacteroides sp.]